MAEEIVEDLAVWGNGDSIIPALPAPWDGSSGESGWRRAWKWTWVEDGSKSADREVLSNP